MRMFMTASYVTLLEESMISAIIYCHIVILIKKLQIGSHFAKIINFGHYRKSIFVLILCTCNLYLWHVVCLKHFIMNNSSFY